MFTKNPKGDVLQISQFEGIEDQNQFVIQKLKNQTDLSQVGVLYRNNLSAICLAEALNRADIPFHLRESGKQRFFSHWAINDILNFLRFSFSDKSLPTFERIWTKLSCPIRKQHLDLLKQRQIDRSIFEILAEQPGVTSKGKSQYLDLKNGLRSLILFLPPRQSGIFEINWSMIKRLSEYVSR